MTHTSDVQDCLVVADAHVNHEITEHVLTIVFGVVPLVGRVADTQKIVTALEGEDTVGVTAHIDAVIAFGTIHRQVAIGVERVVASSDIEERLSTPAGDVLQQASWTP